jgi:hypothetical protein
MRAATPSLVRLEKKAAVAAWLVSAAILAAILARKASVGAKMIMNNEIAQ